MRANKGKWFELCYCLLRLQATLKCETQIGYCNLSPRALVAHTLEVGDTVKYLQLTVPRGGAFSRCFINDFLLTDMKLQTHRLHTCTDESTVCDQKDTDRRENVNMKETFFDSECLSRVSTYVCMGLKSTKLTLVLTDDLHSISM